MKRREVMVEGLAEPISHYADAVVAGDTLYVSGIVPVDGAGALVELRVDPQAITPRQSIDEIRAAAK